MTARQSSDKQLNEAKCGTIKTSQLWSSPRKKFEATKKLLLSSLDSPKQQLVLVQTMVVELVPVVEGGARGLQHHEAFLCA